jgi:hypothetical protein
MLYFFERAGSVIRCEIRLDWNGAGYELVIDAPNSKQVEKFQEPNELNQRWAELERTLLSDGWSEPDGRRS